MSNETGLRGWHTWWSVALALPIAIVSLTAIFIAHTDSLGLKSISLPSHLHLNSEEKWIAGTVDVRALHEHNGTTFVGTKYGLLRQQDGRLNSIAQLAGAEVRGLASSGDTLFVAARNGTWTLHAGEWRQAHKGETWSVTALPGGAVAIATKGSGFLVSHDNGATWESEHSLTDALSRHVAEAGPQKVTLHKLIMDMHTGKAFFGKEYEWLWIDIIAGTMLFLTFSGLFIWSRARRKKRQMMQALQEVPTSKPAAA
jgi:hypothetical protein